MNLKEYPKEIRYQRIKPKGFASQFKEWAVDPSSSNAFWVGGEIVRFLLNMTEGVMDPYRSYIQIDVTTPQNFPIGALQVDNSAQSFISQSVITSNGVEVERISEYDTLAAYLTDVSYAEWITQCRESEGLGTGRPLIYEENRFGRNASTNACIVPGSQGPPYEQVNWGTEIGIAASMPTKMWLQSPSYTSFSGGNIPALFSGANISGNSASHLSLSNQYMLWSVNQIESFQPSNKPAWGGGWNLRAEYAMGLGEAKYPDSNNSYLRSGLVLTAGSAGNSPNNQPYGINQVQTNICYSAQNVGSVEAPNTPSFYGYETPYSAFTSTGCGEPFVSQQIPTCSMQNGQLLQSKQVVVGKRFYVPLLSSVIGTLIPPSSYQLIPLEAMKNLLIELTLSPYAMFSSGYQDRNEFDVNGMAVPIPRNYRIVRIQYVLQMYTFEETVRRWISESLVKGITISSQSWIIGSQYQIPTGSFIKGNWQVNSTAESLAEIVVLFLSNDYAQFPFCRKQFRLSNNISSVQFKFNTEWFPPQPIIGNGGNPEVLDVTGDNSSFFLELLKSNNYFLSQVNSLSRVNRINFAINGRCYDPTNTNTFLPQALKNQVGNVINWMSSTNQPNMDTAMGMPFFHENRYVGRAAYSYSFEPFAHSKEFMMGLDSRQARPFEILLGTHPVNPYPRDQTMYIFLRYNTISLYTKEGIQVIGK